MKRFLALLLAMTMVFGMVPFGALATEPAEVILEEVTAENQAEVMLTDGNISSGTPDGEPPVLTGMTLSVTTVTAPGQIEVTVSATDDVSGVRHGMVEFVCHETGKVLYLELSGTYWDDKTWENVPYPDGNLHGTVTIDQYVESGSFVVASIQVYDIAGNGCYYHYKNSNNPIPDCVANVIFNVVDTEIPDGTPPVITGMFLPATDITAPSEIEVIVSATDDISGLNDGMVEFICHETGKVLYLELSGTYWDDKTWENVPYPDGNLHGKLTIDQYVESGSFAIGSIQVYDVAGNGCYYHYKNSSNSIPECVASVSFFVTDSGTPDGDAPVLTGMQLTATTMTAPGKIEVTVSATDDVSGVGYGMVEFVCHETGKVLYLELSSAYWDDKTWESVPYPDGNLHGTLIIDQYVESGSFVVASIQVYDIAGNGCYYHYKNTSNPIPECVAGVTFNVLNAIPDVTTSVAKPEFAEQVKDAADDAYIVADFSGETTMPEEVFDAIAGTDKTLDLVSEGVTWRFNGEDITNESKPIDLNVQITKAEEETSSSGQEIQNKLDETPAVVMKFAENGQLPGKATIQVKVDYAMREYLGSGKKLCVYYYNNQTGELELVAENLTVLNDTYVEFTITHCSYYILTTKITPKNTWGDNVFWVLSSDGVLTISGTGAMRDIEWTRPEQWGPEIHNIPWLQEGMPAVKEVIIEEGITYIGKSNFEGCRELSKITIPDTVTNMGSSVFIGTALTTIDWPANMYYVPYMAFNGCDNLVSFTGGENVSYVDAYAFFNCPKLESIDLSKVTSIGDGAFANCYALADVTLSPELYFIGYNAFQACAMKEVTLSSNLGVIYSGAFMMCDQLEKLTISEGTSIIKGWAFQWCEKLTSVVIPASVTQISEIAFDACKSLEAVYVLNPECTIPNDYFGDPLSGDDRTARTVSVLGVPGVTTIYGHPNSTAQTYAENNGFAFEKLPETCEFGFHQIETVLTQEKTCTEHGMQEEICKLCGKTVSETLILCTGHDLADGVCTVCGEGFVAQGFEVDWAWALGTDGTLTLFATVDWLPFATGTPWASYVDRITKIVFGDHIAGHQLEWIDDDSPTYLTYPNLTTIELGENLCMAFMQAIRSQKLTKFVIDPRNTSYGVNGGVLVYNFDPRRPEVHYYPATLTATTYRTGPITYIADYAMINANYIEKLYIDAGTIFPAAIRAMKNLADIYILYGGWYPMYEEISDEDKLGDPAKLTIHGIPGSMTEEMANHLGYKFVPLTECDISDHIWVRAEAQNGSVVDTCQRCGETLTHKLLPDGMDVKIPDSSVGTLKQELTKEEVSRVEAGEFCQFYLNTFDISEKVTSGAEQELLEELMQKQLPGYQVGSYMDISLYKQIGGDQPAAITELDEPISVVVDIPVNLQNTSKYIERTYDVVRIHEGESIALGGTYDAETQTFTFETDAFSTYILVYEDIRIGGILGDVNGDDQVTVLDLMRLANFFAGKDVEVNEANADVNGDGKVTVLDLMRLANYFAGKAELG